MTAPEQGNRPASREGADFSAPRQRIRPGIVATGMVVFTLAMIGPATAQHGPAATSRSYPVRQISATALEPTLRGLLPSGTDLFVDSANNRILIQGSAASHDIARRAIHAMDRPASPAVRTVAYVAAEPYLRPYRCYPGQASATAEALRREFGSTPGVNIVPDARTSQVLVTAPESVHTVVASRLQPAVEPEAPGIATATPSAGSPPTAPATASPATAPAPALMPPLDSRRVDAAAEPGPSRRHSGDDAQRFTQSVQVHTAQAYALRATTPQGFERRLIETLGARCIPVEKTSSEQQRGVYRLSLADGATMTLTVDRVTSQVQILGPSHCLPSAMRLVEILDGPVDRPGDQSRLIAFDPANTGSIQRVAQVVAQPGDVASSGAGTALPASPSDSYGPMAEASAADGGRNIVGPVQIEVLPGLESVVVRGDQEDVAQLMKLIEQIEELSLAYEPQITVYPLRHAGSTRLGDLVRELYEEIFSPRQGSVSITSLVKPNALLLIGRPDSVSTAIDLIRRLDRPVPPESQFQVFRLEHAAAETVREQIEDFYADREGLGAEVRITSDYRTNALIVQAAPRDLVEVASMIMRIDTPDSNAVNEIRVFVLKNALAEELADVLEAAVAGQATGAAGASQQQRSSTLAFATVDAGENRLLRSGVLSDVRITPDTRSNAILVSAPSESFPLIEALIRQMDQLPVAEAQIKVFTIVNSDAASLTEMLESLFSASGTQTNQPAVRTGAGADESTLVNLQFAVDVRTNSIIATGSAGDLSVVEAILLRLDEDDIQNRHVTVYRLLNAPAENVATAINDYLQNERQVEQTTTGLISTFEQVEREVVVVPETVSNSLIVSTTPRYYSQIKGIIEQLDERPPMVMIQVLIAEVDLDDATEVGFEAGLQDSILFDRSGLTNVETISRTVSDPGQPQVVTQEIISSDANPGFLFNDVLNPLGNNPGTGSTNSTVGTQGLSNFGMGRASSELGFGGFVFSASSESVSLLVRALQQEHRLEVLSRPQVMTLDQQPAFIQIGERVPRITGTQTNEAGMTNNITMDEVGLILGVTPRISPDGLVVMEIDAEKSAVGPESEGIPVAVQNGVTIRSPRIETTTAQTTISAMNGQTVILGGLITKYESDLERKVPLLGDIPIVGQLFRFDSVRHQRKELLIILTPRVVRTECDMDVLKHQEAQRMHWCMCNVIELNDDPTLRKRTDDWSDMNIDTVYPTEGPAEEIVLPDGMPLPAVPVAPRRESPAPRELELDELPAPTPAPGVYPTSQAPPAAEAGVQPAADAFQGPIESYGRSAVTRADYREPAPRSDRRMQAPGDARTPLPYPESPGSLPYQTDLRTYDTAPHAYRATPYGPYDRREMPRQGYPPVPSTEPYPAQAPASLGGRW